MKVKALSRDKTQFQRQSKTEVVRVQRSLQPELHPFDKAREFQRAVNTVKLNRHFAKPFVAALDGCPAASHPSPLMARTSTLPLTSSHRRLICQALGRRRVHG